MLANRFNKRISHYAETQITIIGCSLIHCEFNTIWRLLPRPRMEWTDVMSNDARPLTDSHIHFRSVIWNSVYSFVSTKLSRHPKNICRRCTNTWRINTGVTLWSQVSSSCWTVFCIFFFIIPTWKIAVQFLEWSERLYNKHKKFIGNVMSLDECNQTAKPNSKQCIVRSKISSPIETNNFSLNWDWFHINFIGHLSHSQNEDP